MNNVLTGRQLLITDLAGVESSQSMLNELERILPYFLANRCDIVYLQNYYTGYHTGILEREKNVRDDINNKTIVNYAWSAVRDIVGYYLGKPIQYVHRESGEEVTNKVSLFNRILDAEDKNLINSQIANDQSICGLGFLGIFKDMKKKNGTSLRLSRLDPAYTFVVYSSDPEVDEVYCVTYFTKQADPFSGTLPETVYTVWTEGRRYTIIGDDPSGFTAAGATITEIPYSYGGYLPIQEYPNNMFRIGDFEPALPIMDAIDRAASNRDNDIEQTIESILVALGVDLSQDGVMEQLQEKGLLNVPALAEGAMAPKIEYIGSPLDPNIGETFSQYLEACMNVVIGIPDRQTRGGSGGDTGAAVELRDGWLDIDLVASFKEGFFIRADRNALGAILYLLKTNKEFTGLDVKDIEIKFSRNKTANIQSKSQALQTFLAAGVSPQDAIEWCDLTTDVLSVVQRMNAYKDEIQERSIAFAKQQQAELGVGTEQAPSPKSKTSTEQGKEPVANAAGAKQ